MARTKLVAYYRVSTKGQGDSGLGLEGQTSAVGAFAKGRGAEIIRAYTEVETGKRADRPELIKALAHAKRSKATLVIAKLDRLSRNVAFMANLMESGVDFTACDNPHANRLTIHILAAVAENEAKMISERTKAALTAYKARGGGLGTARPRRDGSSPRRRCEGPGEVPGRPPEERTRCRCRPGPDDGPAPGRGAFTPGDRRPAQRRRPHDAAGRGLEPHAGRAGPRPGRW